MNRHQSARTLALGAAAFALCLSASPALAFDTVNWTWDLSRVDTKTSTSTSALTAVPTGDMTVEARQIYIGNVNADADAGATVTPTTTLATPYDAATDLGHVEASSAAYANVYSGGSEVPLTVNLGQYHVGAVDTAALGVPTAADPLATNANHAYADKLIADAAAGLFTPHEMTASATATNVRDATALAESRAVSNSISLELAAAPAEPLVTDPVLGADPSAGFLTNALMASDTTQLSIGHIDARSVSATDITGYAGLGAVDRPLSQATATAIGNLNTSVTRIGTLDQGL